VACYLTVRCICRFLINFHFRRDRKSCHIDGGQDFPRPTLRSPECFAILLGRGSLSRVSHADRKPMVAFVHGQRHFAFRVVGGNVDRAQSGLRRSNVVR